MSFVESTTSSDKKFFDNLFNEMKAEKELEIQELQRLSEFINEANKISMYKFKYQN